MDNSTINQLDYSKQSWNQEKYDNFLKSEKKDTFIRLDPFINISKSIRHQCRWCERIWKPSPKQCFNDDYYCPSCALHHRNNMERFKEKRFEWTVSIPNTFYLYKITDPQNKKQYIKYGRTQHKSSALRYVKKEVDLYNMKMQLNLRGPLKNMIAIENFWKQTANQYQCKPLFSNPDFHGATECIDISEKLYDIMVKISKQIQDLDYDSYEIFDLKLIDKSLQEQYQNEVQQQNKIQQIQQIIEKPKIIINNQNNLKKITNLSNIQSQSQSCNSNSRSSSCSSSSSNSSSRSRSRSNSPQNSRDSSKLTLKDWNQEKYDKFLKLEKKDTFFRVEPFITISKPIKHKCSWCKRVWKPSPKQCFNDDYYCPSCALHHRNNMERFKEKRFEWTVSIPNTFYLYKITDPQNKKQYIKYGRTQHKSSALRYVKKEVDLYNMKMQLNLRGPLKNMIAIENFWKQTANQYQCKPLFSNPDFHGATECIDISEKLYDIMVKISKQIKDLNYDSYQIFDLKLIDKSLQEQFLNEINLNSKYNQK